MIHSRRAVPSPRKTGPITGINFVGMLSHKGGIGNAARMNCRALKVHSGYKLAYIDFPKESNRRAKGLPEDFPYNLNIFHFNPDHASLDEMLECRWFGYRNIMYAAWETTKAPESWKAWSRWIDQLWVPSQFTKDAVLAAGWDGDIHVIPHFCQSPVSRKWQKGNAADKLRFYLTWDGKSRIERKLPHLAIAAAIVACDKMGVSGSMTIKSHDEKLDAIQSAIKLAADLARNYMPPGSARNEFEIEIENQWMCEAEVTIVMMNCDAVISLNRGEGFGLVGLEAMSCGIPVVWTGWGGSMEYLTQENSYLVDPVAIIPVANDALYKTGKWAEPSFDHAVAQICQMISDMRSGKIRSVMRNAREAARRFSQKNIVEKMKIAIGKL